LQLEDFEVVDHCSFVSDGVEAVDETQKILDSIPIDMAFEKPYQPIQIMLLDFNMPHMNGLQVIDCVKEMYATKNNDLVSY